MHDVGNILHAVPKPRVLVVIILLSLDAVVELDRAFDSQMHNARHSLAAEGWVQQPGCFEHARAAGLQEWRQLVVSSGDEEPDDARRDSEDVDEHETAAVAPRDGASVSVQPSLLVAKRPNESDRDVQRPQNGHDGCPRALVLAGDRHLQLEEVEHEHRDHDCVLDRHPDHRVPQLERH